MTHTRIMHWGRSWPRPKNHLDGRVCPDCAATVHGHHAQHAHQTWHAELAEVLESVSERAGAEPQESPPWTAAVDETDDQAAIEDAG